MKIIKTLLLATLLSATSVASAKTIEIDVNGLVCAFCAQGIEKALKRLPATQDVFVSLEHRLVAVALTPGQSLDEVALRAAITDAGYSTVAVTRSDASLDEVRARTRARIRERSDD
jgi:mercuric ion binding protein